MTHVNFSNVFCICDVIFKNVRMVVQSFPFADTWTLESGYISCTPVTKTLYAPARDVGIHGVIVNTADDSARNALRTQYYDGNTYEFTYVYDLGDNANYAMFTHFRHARRNVRTCLAPPVTGRSRRGAADDAGRVRGRKRVSTVFIFTVFNFLCLLLFSLLSEAENL